MPNSPPTNEGEFQVQDIASGAKERRSPALQAGDQISGSSEDADSIIYQEACEIASLKIRKVSAGCAKQDTAPKKRYESPSEVKCEGNTLFDIREESLLKPNSLDETSKILENALIRKISQRLDSFESDASYESILSKLDRESSLKLSDDENIGKKEAEEESSAETKSHKTSESDNGKEGGAKNDLSDKDRSPSPDVEHEPCRSTSPQVFSKIQSSLPSKDRAAEICKVKPVEGGVVMPWPARADVEYECIESCGAGSYGEVYKARRRSDGQLVAVKVLESDRYALGEASLLRELDHECICKLLDCFECVNEGVTCLVMQYASGGDLLERIVKNGPLTEPVAAEIAKHLLEALQHMHSKGVVHRDLKPENVLYSSEDSRKPLLADFGVGKRLNAPCDRVEESEAARNTTDALKTHTQQIGTLGYSAPEVFSEQGHSFAADVWSFGAMIYVLLCGYHPFDMGDDADEVIQERVRNGEVLPMRGGSWSAVSEEAKDFVSACLKVDVAERLTVDQCLKHAWLSKDFMDVVELVDAFGRLQFYHNSRRESRNQAAAQTATRVKRKREASVASDDGSAGSLTPTPSKNLKSISRPLPTTAEAYVHEGVDPFSEEDVESNMGEMWLAKTKLDHEKRDRKRVHAEKAGGLQTCPEVSPPSNSLTQQEARVEPFRDDEGEGVRDLSLRDLQMGSDVTLFGQDTRREKKGTAKTRNKLKANTDCKKDNLTLEFDNFCSVEGLAINSIGSLSMLTQEEAAGKVPAGSKHCNSLHNSESLLSELHIEDGEPSRSDIAAEGQWAEATHAERPAAKRRTNSEAPVPDSSPQLQPLIVDLTINEGGEPQVGELELEQRRKSLSSEATELSLGIQLESQLELHASSEEIQRRKRERSDDWASLDAARLTEKGT